MNALPQTAPAWVTEAEYTDYCQNHPEYKFELIDGEIVAMAGASFNHNLLTLNMAFLLKKHLSGTGCFVLASDWQVKTQSNFYYPDVVVDCDPENGRPKVIVEVLSESTRHIDLTIKLEDYKKISSLQEYLVVEQNARFMVLYRRQNAWRAEVYQEGKIVLDSIGLTLDMEEIYQEIVFQSKTLKLLKK